MNLNPWALGAFILSFVVASWLGAQLPTPYPQGSGPTPNPEPARASLFTTRFRHKDTGVLYAPGTQVHRAGDVNNDGIPDFIVSMPPIGANWNGPASLNTGTVFLRSGVDGAIIHQ